MRRLQDKTLTIKWLVWQAFGVIRNRLQLSGMALLARLGKRKTRFLLDRWYGRTGNNIQQILVALAHADAFCGSFELTSDQLVLGDLAEMFAPLSMDCNPGRSENGVFRSKFFHFTEYRFLRISLRRMHFRPGAPPRLESWLGREWMEAHLHRIAQQHLRKHLIVISGDLPPSESLVLCLRAGDVQGLENLYYITNPLVFYRRLADEFRHVIIVTEPRSRHFLLSDICDCFEESRIEFTPYEKRNQGFELLRQAVHLATSGVSSFPLSAALLSKRLRTFHGTNMYMDEHLNPRMLPSSVRKNEMTLPDYPYYWTRAYDRRELLIQYDLG